MVDSQGEFAEETGCFSMEWPPKSGRQQEFPEVDRAGWFAIPDALEKILSGQRDLVVELARIRGL